MHEFEKGTNFVKHLGEGVQDFKRKTCQNHEEHKGDIEIKKGLYENTCTGEMFVELNGQGLSTFPWQNFKDAKNLVYIYLSDNHIKQIDGAMFAAFPNLKYLDLRDNELNSFPKEVLNHPNLNTILLDGNEITELPLELGSLSNLRGLFIHGNPITFPSNEILELNKHDLINYFRRCWKEQTHEVPLHEPAKKKMSTNYSKLKTFKPIEDVGKFVSRKMKSRDVVDQILADSVLKKIEKQNNILQKKKQLSEELMKLQEALDSVPRKPIPSSTMDTASIREMMASRIEEIKAVTKFTDLL
uniref:Leucine-rich repeat protein soc-2 homolog n=1 Tax=Rhodnius prolixus TaxID=13249 RepID=T1HWJ4_RHOPR